MITFDHGNDAGTGMRLAVDVVPPDKERKGSVTLSAFPQEGPRGEDGKPRFADRSRAEVSIGVVGIAHVINVLDGVEVSLRGGRGVSSKQAGKTETLHIDKVWEPYQAFAVHILCRLDDGSKSDGRIVLSITEGAALSYSLKSAMGTVAFGCAPARSRCGKAKSKVNSRKKENTK